MRRFAAALISAAVLAAFVLPACGGSDDGTHLYGRNDLQLITAFTAKELCSCLFVAGHTEDDCRAYAKQAPPVASAQIDLEGKAVTSSALMLWSARAHWVDEKTGCVLEE